MTGVPPKVTLEDLLTGWNSAADEHRAALGDGWEVARDFLQLHREAMAAFSARIGATPSEREQATLRVAVHAHNVFVSMLGLIIRGQFDVALYLFRPLFVSETFLPALVRHDDLARQLLFSKLEGSKARKRSIADLRDSGDAQLADDIDTYYKAQYKAWSNLAHTGSIHMDMLLERAGEVITPTLAGRRDIDAVVQFSRAAYALEDETLGSFVTFLKPALSDDWQRRHTLAHTRYQNWMTATDEDEAK